MLLLQPCNTIVSHSSFTISFYIFQLSTLTIDDVLDGSDSDDTHLSLSSDSDENERNVRQRNNSDVDVTGQGTSANTRRNPNANRGGPANAADNNTGEAQNRTQLGGFVTTDGTRLRSQGHTTALVGILQLASGHPEGIIGALGYNSRTRWFQTHTNALFANDGPLSAYRYVEPATLMRHFTQAQRLARTFYTRDHSNEQTGRAHEDIPQWTNLFFRLFEAADNQETRNSRTAAARDENRAIARGVIGAQAPLGVENNGHPVQLRTETSRNVGQPGMRQQSLGSVQEERVNLMEGRDDVVNRRPAPQRSNTNGRHHRTVSNHRNVHIDPGFDPETNAPSERYRQIMIGYRSVNALIDTYTRFAEAPLPMPGRERINIARDYNEITQMLANATTDEDRQFFRSVRDALVEEMQHFDEGHARRHEHDEPSNL